MTTLDQVLAAIAEIGFGVRIQDDIREVSGVRYTVFSGHRETELRFAVLAVDGERVKLRPPLAFEWDVWVWREQLKPRLQSRLREMEQRCREMLDGLRLLSDHKAYERNYGPFTPFKFGDRVRYEQLFEPALPDQHGPMRPRVIGMVRSCKPDTSGAYGAGAYVVDIAPDGAEPGTSVLAPDYRVHRLLLDQDPSEVRRLYEDWFGKCRTCRFWGGDRGSRIDAKPGRCEQPASDLYKDVTWTEGRCDKWDPFEDQVIWQVLNESNKESGQ